MIRVLIIDDSAYIRKILTEELSKYTDIEVVGSAIDPYVARNKIVRLHPDVITLDLEMPGMGGLLFLEKLMKHYPLPVVVVSSPDQRNGEVAIKALELGAVEVISKPESIYAVHNIFKHLVYAIRTASSVRFPKRKKIPKPPVVTAVSTPHSPLLKTQHYKVLAIGASTGGTQAIETILKGLPVTAPGTVIVQHMPKYAITTFARRLNKICQIEVREARDNDKVVPGVALIAPGSRHMILQQNGAHYLVKVNNGPAIHHQRPSVDVLFKSVARSAGQKAIGVLLTGMGVDGAKGLLAMRESGAYTLAQDERTCIVFGMPEEAIALGAAVKIVPLPYIVPTIINILFNKIKIDRSRKRQIKKKR